ncbi:hypothetical protein O181_103413 [Austropuccinia psidii MF-1]|uniref:Uncharacterized protein n=1 Tax=Austropuccinia psidii MF-1 TaxID=1389203 RepID=A0A9Q3JKB1_9BASI|nr:hypothetical protein [Austropuccinia psidii MF-1]
MDQDSRIGVTLSTKAVALMAPFDAAERRAELIAAGRKSLPLNDWMDQFLQGVAEMLVLIVVGETGAGQTTQLSNCWWQPESLEELFTRVGYAVHYSIWFEDSTSPIAMIKSRPGRIYPLEFLYTSNLHATYLHTAVITQKLPLSSGHD